MNYANGRSFAPEERIFRYSEETGVIREFECDFRGEVKNILKRSDDVKRTARRAASGETGILRIGFIAPATASILPLLVQTYLGRYPDVELQLQHMNPDDQLAAFDEEMLELGLSRPLPAERQHYFEEEIVYVDHLTVILSPSHPLAKEKRTKLEKLAAEPFVPAKRLKHLKNGSGRGLGRSGFEPLPSRFSAIQIASILIHPTSPLD
jgi:DNA-binding transcriptional LysR family regulator